ncbi:type III secretion system inner rod subunit SctI [Burkholderia ubonensis]|uniref:type III secretion system inner rod subunit SctI n=1 Tax=Burkholderia ubonensis TaxID=101571 RepID=UPI0008FDA5F9|nr:type III secretion system inner rod subunit SctI [Burkholderia ubonensis]
MNITNLHLPSISSQLSEIDSTGRHTSLDAILRQTIGKANDSANSEKSRIEAGLSNPVDFTHPGKLIALQSELSNYSIYVSLASTLTRKAVSAVETLVKAQ